MSATDLTTTTALGPARRGYVLARRGRGCRMSMVLHTRPAAAAHHAHDPHGASVLLVVAAALAAVWLAGAGAYAAPSSPRSETNVSAPQLAPRLADQPPVAGARVVLNENP